MLTNFVTQSNNFQYWNPSNIYETNDLSHVCLKNLASNVILIKIDGFINTHLMDLKKFLHNFKENFIFILYNKKPKRIF